MPGNGNSINFRVGFTVDKTGLNELQRELQQIRTASIQDLTVQLDTKDAIDQLRDIQDTASQISAALQSSFNADLGTTNLTKFSQELKDLDLQKVEQQFSKLGTTGQSAFRNLSAQLLSTNTQLKQSHTLLDAMADTLSRTVKWSIASSAVNRLTGSIQEAYGYVKSLDTSLNNIQIVTEKSADDMAEFAVQANNAAKALGASTTDYTNASLLFYQQGLSDEEVQARADVTLKAANITGQAASAVSEELTAVWNGYQITSDQAEASIDILAAVAANTASNLEELSTGMSKVASSANAMGVSEEQLAAQISTITSATRQAPETTGQALRTIYARMSTISAGGVDDEDGATLTSYSAKMNKFGISVLDANGKLRDMGEVIEEIGEEWDTFTREQQISLAQAMAGTRQYNNLLALFENWDEYTRALDIANNSLGTLQTQQDIYMESTAAHLQQLDTAWEDLFDSLFSGSDINKIVDMFTPLVQGAADFVDAIGGGIPLLTSLGSIGLSVFSTQIGRGLEGMISNLRIANTQLTEQNDKLKIAEKYGLDYDPTSEGSQRNEATEAVYKVAKELYGVDIDMTQEEKKQTNEYIQRQALLENEKESWNDRIKSAQLYINTLAEGTDTQVEAVNVTTSSGQETNVKTLNQDAEQLNNTIDHISNTFGTATSQAEMLQKAIQGVTSAQKELNDATTQVGTATNQEYTTRIPKNISELQTQLSTDASGNKIPYSQRRISNFSEAEVNDYIERLATEGKKSAEAEEELRAATEKSTAKTKENVEALISQCAAYRDAKKGADGHTDAVKEHTKAQEELTKAEERQEKASSDLQKANDDLAKTGEESLKQAETYLANFQANGINDSNTKQLQKIVDSIHKVTEETGDATDETQKSAQVSAEQWGELQKAIASISPELDQCGQAAIDTAEDIRAKTPDIMGARAESLQQDIDKFKQVLTDEALGKAISNTVGSLGRLASGISIIQNLGNIISNDNLTTTQKFTQVLTNLVTGTTMVISSFSGLRKGLQTLGDELPKVGTAASNVLTSLSSWQKVVGVVAVAAVTALVTGIYNAVKAADEAKNHLENLTNQVDTLKSVISDCTTAIEDFNNSFDNYQDAIDALAELEEGTEEYKDALEEANAAARELIETYGLFGQYTYENGRIVINEEALNGVQGQLNAQQRTAQNSLYSTQIAQQQAQNNLNFRNSDLSDVLLEFALKNEDEIVSIFKVLGTQDNWSEIGDWLKSYSNDQTESNAALLQTLMEVGSSIGEDFEEALDNEDFEKLADIMKNSGVDNADSLEKFAKTLGSLDDVINRNIRTIYDNIDAIEDFSDSLENAAEANDYYAQQLLGNIINEEYGEQIKQIATNSEENINEDLASQLTAYLAKQANKRDEETGLTLAESIAAIDTSGTRAFSALEGIDTTTDVVKAYATQVLGIAEDEVESSIITFSNGFSHFIDEWFNTSRFGTATMTNQSGTEVSINSVSLSHMAEEIARVQQEDKLISDRQEQLAEADDALAGSFLNLSSWLNDTFGTLGNDILFALVQSLYNEADNIDLTSLFDELSPGDILNLTNFFNSADWANGLDKNDLIVIYGPLMAEAEEAGGDAAIRFGQGMIEGLSEYESGGWTDAYYDRLTSTAASTRDTIVSLMADIQSGNVTSGNITEYDNYDELLSQLKDIAKEYPELNRDVETLNSTWLVGTQEYIEALQHVQDATNKINYDHLNKEAQKAKDTVLEFFDVSDEGVSLNIEANPDAFLDAMNDLLNAEYAIEVEVHTEAENEFNSITAAMDNLHNKVSLIGDDFIVAASDIRELNNTFPGILEGLDYIGDGLIQLNEEVVQSAINAAEAEVAADMDAAIDKLEINADELRAKEKTYTQIAEAARICAEGQVDDTVDTTEAEAILWGALANEQIEDSEGAANEQMVHDSEVSVAAYEAGEAIATSFGSAYEESLKASAEFAKGAAQNMRAAAEGDEGSVVSYNIKVNYQGAYTTPSTATSSEENYSEFGQELKKTLEEQSAESYLAIAETAETLAASYAAAANDVEGMIAELGARGYELANDFENIASGGNATSSGGSSGSVSEPKQEDQIKDEADRYHDVNVRLKEISTSLSRLQKQEDKLLGSNLVENLNEQLVDLNAQIDATNDKIAIAEGEAQEYRDQLSSQGVLFDANGDITNYAQVMQQQLDYVNSIVDAYNAMTAEEQEAYQDTLDAAKEGYNDFVSAISRYEDIVLDEIPGYYDDIQDAVDKEIEINISRFTAEIEIRLDMRSAEQDWDEFYRKVVLGLDDSDIYGNAVQNLADILSYLNTTAADILTNEGETAEDWLDAIQEAIYTQENTGTAQKLAEQIYDTIDQLEAIENGEWATVYGDNEAQALEDLQTYYTELMNELEDIYDLTKEIEDSYLDMIDEAVDRFDEQVSQYEYINDLLNHDINLVGLLYGDDAYEQMSRYYEQIEANNNQELDFLRKRVDYAYQMMQAETDDEARKKWEEEWETALSDLNDKVEDSVQNLVDKYVNAINQIIDELNKSVTEGLGLDYVGEEWDLMNQEADIYLDKINSMYAIQEIQNKYLEAIDLTDSISAQQKLNDAMEQELEYLENKENLTQYDIDRAELLYEITLKQISLEEAQQNKSTMRLRRDSQGNYSYQFVSDQDEINTLQQELADLQNQLYNFDKDAYINNLNEIYSVYEEFQQKILDLYADQTLSAEERERQIALYVEYYGNIINDLVTENEYIRTNLAESATTELAELYGIDVDNFRDMTEEEIDDLMTNLVPQWDSGVQHMTDTFAGDGGFIACCTDAFEELDAATKDYERSLDELERVAGIDFDSIAKGYDENIELAQDLIETNDDLIDSYSRQISAIQNVIDTVHELSDAYDEYLDLIEAVTAAYKEYQTISKNAAEAYEEDYEEVVSGRSSTKSQTVTADTGYTQEEAKVEETVEETPAIVTTQGNGIPEVGDTATYLGGIYYSDSYGSTPSGSRGPGKTVTITSVKTDGRPYPIHVMSTDSAYGWLKQDQLSGYDTGGYTGEWSGDDGQIALLHQKELVLNQTDTENILTAVGLVRDMSTLLESLDTSVLAHIADLKSSMMTGFSERFENGNQELEQNVHIEASFPNVRDSQEIEDAFNNLVNIASMRAYRS